MEKCKFCQAELEEGVTLCPACGKDNAGEAAAPAKASPMLIAALVVAVVALIAAMAALVIMGMDKPVTADPTQPQIQTEATLPADAGTVEATVPEGDGDSASVFCKGTYTASSEDVIAAKDTVVATAGDFQLTLGELQMYYWQEVSGFLGQYGSYASYYGLDITQPLDTQPCMVMEGMTWQQYFLYSAMNSWHTYQALSSQAEAEGFQLPQDYADQLADLPNQLDEQAAANGFDSAQSLMTYNVGSGCTIEDYLRFMEIYYRGYTYYNDFYTNVTASEEDIEAMFTAHEAEYAQAGLTKDTKTVNVRHILIYPEGATTETIRTETFSEEAWAAGKASAEALLNQWLEGDATEDSFAALAVEHSQDGGSAANGGLYTDVYEGDMVQNFNDWCFSAERQVGDYGIVETEFGYHIMFYSGDALLWTKVVEQDVLSQKTNDMVDTALANHPLTVHYDQILIALAEVFRAA